MNAQQEAEYKRLLARDKRIKANKKAYRQRPEYKAYMKVYYQSPRYKAYQREYYRRPEVKAKYKIYQQSPRYKAYRKAYSLRPDVKIRRFIKLDHAKKIQIIQKHKELIERYEQALKLT